MKKLITYLIPASILAVILAAGIVNASFTPVVQGGTGVQSLTPYAIITGGTTQTAQVQNLTIGNSGQVLTSNGASALPTWQAGTISSVSNSDGTLTISPTAGAVVSSLALGHPNTWTGTQTFNNGTYSALFTGGNVGIGTSTPANKLVIVPSSNNSNVFVIRDTTNSSIRGAVGLDSSGNANFLFTNAGGATTVFLNSSGSSYFTGGFVGIGKSSPTGLLTTGGNWSSAAWGLNGINIQTGAATYTDTSSTTGTVTNNMVNTFGIPTLAATNTGIIYTNAATVYIAGAPVAGTNVTVTNLYALDVASGNTFLQGLSINVGSDSTGDLLYRASTGLLARLGIGSTGQHLVVSGGIPAWVAQANVSNYTHTIFTPTTGQTVSLVDNQYNIINPAGALPALTVNLPSSPANNDVVYIKFTQTVSTVTYANGTVVDGITAPTAGGLTVLTFDSASSSWY